jgi:hypothetical protein
MKKLFLLVFVSSILSVAYADDNSSGDSGLVNNADLNRRMASNKQFSNKKSDNKVGLDDQAKNSTTVNLKSASNKLF